MFDFTHLHVHSTYSILDGMSPITALVDKAIEAGMHSIALTIMKHVWHQTFF
jgi:DNA polymerase-3 subunit alpha